MTWRVALALVSSWLPFAAHAASPDEETPRLVVFVDRDDDDDDGLADGRELPALGRANDVAWLPKRLGPFRIPREAPPELRLFESEARLTKPGAQLRNLGIQALAPGVFELTLGPRALAVDAVEVRALDAQDHDVDPATSRASLSRALPAELGGPARDPEGLRFSVLAPFGTVLTPASVVSRDESGRPIDALSQIELEPATCPEDAPAHLACFSTPEVRAVGLALERTDPRARARSLRAQLGGSLELLLAGRKALRLRVGGPRGPELAFERLRAHLRVFVVREHEGGTPAIGGSDAGALELARQAIASAEDVWGQCGISFGPRSQLEVRVVDPPPRKLLSLGCGFGLPASGGELRLRADGRELRLLTHAGESPVSAAARLSEALRKVGVTTKLYENARRDNEAVASADLFRSDDRDFPAVFASSTDATLSVCLASVTLNDGLNHFGDSDAYAGTLEERALVRAFDDGDPTTIEVFVIPAFARSARIGESFMATPGASLSNLIIVDRAAIRAGERSFALAHELGHVLLAMPGHPDDFGVDQSWALMDADVADGTIFGPRRLSLDECARAVRENGPDSPSPLLAPWPLRPRLRTALNQGR